MTTTERLEAQTAKVKAAKEALEREMATLRELVEAQTLTTQWPQPRA